MSRSRPETPLAPDATSLPLAAGPLHDVRGLRTVRSLQLLTDLLGRFTSVVRGLLSETSPVSKGMRRLGGRGRRLQVSETVQLGEKRFVAILRVDGEQFLIGGGATGVSLLATLSNVPAASTAEPVQVVALADEHPVADDTCSFSALLTAESCRRGEA